MKRTWVLGIAVLGLACGNTRSATPESTPRAGWLAGVERHLAEREYHASETRNGLQAPNRRHELRSYFSADGVRVVDRSAAGSPELVALSLEGFGREGALHVAVPGEVSHEQGRVEIARGDALVEWYENGPDGLEQGFTLAERPAGDGPLLLDVAVASADVSPLGDGLEFESQAGRRLRYAKLHVEDAKGETLAARFATSDSGFRILVDDASASYPVVIDPLLTESFDNDVQSNQMTANLGICTASAGDVNGDGFADVVVGAYFYDDGETDEGAAFVFHGGAAGIGDGNPTNAATQLESNQATSRFGFGCASAGDVNGDGYDDVIIGAFNYANGQTGEGAAFVFHGGPLGVADGDPGSADSLLESDQATAFMGRSVASAGDVNGDGYADVIVGADQYDAAAIDDGAAFIFHGSPTGIGSGGAAAADSQLDGTVANARFGRSVASAGDVNGDGYADVIVGEYLSDGLSNGAGAAFLYHGGPSGIASGDTSVHDSVIATAQIGAELGISVAGAGDVNGDGYADVIIGAHLYDAGETDEGAAFVFHGSATGLPAAVLAEAGDQLESDLANALFGGSVASAGDVNGDGYADVIVGAQSFTAGQIEEGAAFVFLGGSGGIGDGNPTSAYAQLESDQEDARLGRSVSSAGDVNGDGYDDVIVGANRFDGPQTDEGKAFVYHGGASGIADGGPTTAHAQLESNQISAFLGRSVASAGDINGDGYGDVIVGATGYDNGETDEGAAFLFLGSAAGIADGNPGTVHAQLESNQDNAGFGIGVASAGDVNGDGYGDVIVGATSYDNGQNDEGAAFLFLGSAAGIADGDPDSAHAQLESNQDSARFGWSVASAGDVNGDGYADVIVGAWSYDDGQSDEGAAFLFLGSAAGIVDGDPDSAHAQLESNQATAHFGIDVASAGDVNGDGYADVIIGARVYDSGEINEGAAFIFHGAATGVANGNPGTADTQLESDQNSAGFGVSVASAGDVNGDGYADVIVGSSAYDADQSDEGAAFVFHGSATGIANGTPATANAELESDQPFAQLGASVASAGDIDGDGYGDVIVGAPSYGGSGGGAFVFHGSATGVADGNPATASSQLTSPSLAQLGASVASAGDVNGDGFADVIVGALQYDAGETNEGAAFVFLGNAEGRPTRSQQRRADASGVPVQPGGISFAAGGFQAEMFATSPRGRELGKLQVEACPSGAPFGDFTCTVHTSFLWTDLGTTGATLVEDIAGIAGGPVFHWRARVLTVPFTANQPGITPNPRAGPWHRFQARSNTGDIRLPEPGLTSGLAAGLVLLGALRRRRDARRTACA